MKTSQILLFTLFLCCSNLRLAYALAPVESLVLGDFSGEYSENKTDPLSYVFSRDHSLKNADKGHKLELATYRGFYEEGKNTYNYCKDARTIRYTSPWEKVQVMRSTMALIQYIGLDLSVRALPQYAKALDFSREEYKNFAEGLVGNNCSNNLSVISKKELLNNLFLKFDKENNFKLPTVLGNPYFPYNMEGDLPSKKAIEHEFLYTVKLFQSLCSWTGDPNNPGLMVPILKHSALMSFFTRQMNNQNIGWRETDNTLFLREDKQTAQVWCDNLICRKTPREIFWSKVYFSIGGTNLGDDLKRLYCEDFRSMDYKPKESDPRLAKIMNSISFDEEHFINSQFIALITGVPDFLLRGDKFTDGEDTLRSSVDYTWIKWAKNVGENFTRELFYEEPLTLELVDRIQYHNFRSPNLKIAFDVNLGEFDRINQRAGKLKVKFKLNVQNSFLKYFRSTMKSLNFNEAAERVRLHNRFKLQLVGDVQAAKEKFLIPPWKGDLEGLIASEMASQILDTPEKFLNFEGTGTREIEVEINYGLFALKYLNHQLNAQKGQEKTQLPKK
jgi:hypothetical protein